MNENERSYIKQVLRDLIILLRDEGKLNRFPFFVYAFNILDSNEQSQAALIEFKELLLEGMELGTQGSFSDLVLWRENEQDRLKINQKLDDLSNQLLEQVKKIDG